MGRKKKEDLDTFFRRKLVGTVKAVAHLKAQGELSDWEQSNLAMLEMQELGFRKIVKRLSEKKQGA